MSAAVVETLYFGTDMQGPDVSDDEWKAFVDAFITPVIPGFTIFDGDGQWHARNGSLVREKTYVLQFTHPPSEDYTARVEKIAAEYQRRFKQEAVGRTLDTTCAKF